MSDFPTERVLRERAHRPWPMPATPWIMTQTWNDLLFAHWPVDARVLRDLVPAALDLDLFEGRAYVGIVPFHMTNVAPRAVPAIPFISAFPELNVRTYVVVDNKPGVYFFSLDASSQLAVMTARAMFGLPYFTASMDVEVDGNEVVYASRRTSSDGAPAEFRARYRPVGEVFTASPGTLEWFLTERYCLYNVNSSRQAQRLEIHHPQWPLQPAEAAIEANTMADAVGLQLPSVPPLLHFAKRQDMVAWPMSRA